MKKKTVVWFDDRGYGGLRNSERKGQRLAISALLSLNGFHLRFLDIFKCAEVHSMDNNPKWHYKLAPESEPSKRAWKKQLIADWLTAQKIKYKPYMTKVELMQLVFTHLPPKEFIVDKVATKYNIEIVRIPVKHCVSNPIELGWAGLKNYVQQQNVRFRLDNIEQLCNE
ncbi:unnamed protein product [Rotaria sordida]|uniref:Uncharacterized protein n=1 Tax=Rotaria sordida TaxID=392033 RepID=A0A815W8K2_9BILA|nr:unnamed protein product [Rotaria sordida]CAF1670099.1 unnamed protein product [Rotaria sordida]